MFSPRSAPSFALIVVVASGLGCPAPEPPPLQGVQVGTLVGEVFIEDPDRQSIGDAVVTVLGSPASAVSVANKQFVLESVALGTRTVSIVHEALGRATVFDVEIKSPFQTVTLDAGDTTLKRAAAINGTVLGVSRENLPQVFLVGGTSQQVANVGDDGTFALANLPAARVQIGFAAVDRGLVVQELDLVEGETTSLSPVTLEASSVGDLRITGRVRLAGETEHTGISVILNGGSQVVAADDDGVYVFSDLSPGLFTIEARRPGFRSVLMPTVALSADGSVDGIFDAFLAPGQDDASIGGGGDGGEEGSAFQVFIDNPRVGDRIFASDELVLGARLEGSGADAVANSELSWDFRAAGGGGALTSLGTGRVVVVDTGAVPGLLGEIELVLSGVHAGLTDVATATVFVDPLIVTPTFNARVDLALGSSAIALPSISVGVDGVITLPMTETQPVALTATVLDGRGVDVSGGLEWASDTGFFFTGPESALSVLPVGTHTFAVRFSDGQDLIDAASVVVVVAPLEFALTIEAPLDVAANPAPRGDVLNNPPYFDDTGVPLLALVDHPFQLVFPVTAATWRDGDGDVIATGPLVRQLDGSFRFTGRARDLSPGAHLLSLELSDVQGNATSSTTLITVQEVVFDAVFALPLIDADVEEGDAVVVDVDVEHSLLGNGLLRSDLHVSYTSSLVGLLRNAGGASVFGVDETPALVGMGIGRHTLTARVTDGRGVAAATRDVVVRRPGVNINILEPADDSALSPGLPVRFTATAVEDDANDDATFRWLIDGEEIDATFGDYGTDAANPTRLTIDLGAFAADVGIFADPRLAPGPHLLSFCATLEGLDSCQSVDLEVPPLGFELCPSVSPRSITAGQTEVWEEVRRLNCDVTVNGGTLIIAPGARIVIDDLGSGLRFLAMGPAGGSIHIGDIGSNRPAIIESNTRVGASWFGLQLQVTGTTAASVVIENAILRDADRAIRPAFGGVFESEQQQLSLHKVSFEKVGSAWENLCPDLVDDVTIDNADFSSATAVIFEGAFPRCFAAPRTYTGLHLNNVTRGIVLTRAGTVTVENSTFHTFDSSIEPSVFVSTSEDASARLFVQDSVFDDCGDTFNPVIEVSGCVGLTARRNTFTNNRTAVADDPDECRFFDSDESRLLLVHNRFEGNDVAVDLRNGISRAELHLNAFVDNAIDLRADGILIGATYGVDVDARGNFFDRGTLFLRGIGAGRTLNLAGIVDFFDVPASDRVVRTTPTLINVAQAGPTATTRTALVGPDQQARLTPGMCVAPEVFALDGAVSFVDDGAAALAPGECAVFTIGASGDADGLDLTPVSVDDNGCIDVDFAPGEHAISVHCAHAAGVDVHDARFLVDATRFSGPLLGAPEVHWSGEVVLDGDVTVPAGTTLVIEPGTTVRLATTDRLAGQIFHNHGDNPDGTDNSCTGCFSDNVVNGSFGERALVDIFVDGDLVAEGTALAPIVFLPEDAVVAPSKWGGIRLALGSSASLSHVDIGGADIALHGEFAPIDPFSEPVVDVSDSVVRETRVGLRGPCPVTFSGNVMNRVIEPMGDLFCSTGLVIADSDFVDVGNPSAVDLSPLFSFGSYSSGGSDGGSIVFSGVTLSRLGGTNEQAFVTTLSQARIATIAIRDSDIENINALVHLNGDRLGLFVAAVVERTTVTNFDRLVQDNGFGTIDRADIDQCRFTRGNELFATDDSDMVRDIEMTRTAISNVVTPFKDTRLDGNSTFRLVVTDNSFDTATDIFQVAPLNITTDRAVDARRNNFTNVSGRIVDVNSTDADSQISIDVSGSFFGTTDSVAIEAALDDPQLDLGADFKGRCHYAPFSTTALNQDLLP